MDVSYVNKNFANMVEELVFLYRKGTIHIHFYFSFYGITIIVNIVILTYISGLRAYAQNYLLIERTEKIEFTF